VATVTRSVDGQLIEALAGASRVSACAPLFRHAYQLSDAGSEAYGNLAGFEAEAQKILGRLVELLGDVTLLDELR
jgi:hypothetical protein